MNRREILKFTLLAPLVGLFKKKSEKKPPLMYCDAEGNKGIVPPPSGTFPEHPAYVVWWDSEENLSRFKRISNEEFYKLRGNESNEPQTNT